MIDTLNLTLDSYRVKRSNALNVQRNFVCGIETDMRGLFRYEDGEVQGGAKVHWNADKIFFDVKRRGKEPHTSVHFSAPRIVGKNNFFPADRNEVEKAIETVERRLCDEAGVITDLSKAKLSRVDMTKNAILVHPVTEYSNVYQLIGGSRMKNRTDYPSGFLLDNTAREVCFYDKRLEMEHKKEEISSVPFNTLRCEVRALGNRSIKSMIGLETVSDMLTNFERVPLAYESVMSDVFKYTARDLKEKVMTEYERIMYGIKERCGSRWMSQAISSIGAEALYRSLGREEGLRAMFYRMGFNKNEVYRYVKVITSRRNDVVSQGSLFGEHTIGELYNEVKEKLLKAA